MSSLNEKFAFSERLQTALTHAGYAISPTALAKEFNLRFNGTEISVQSANNWLQGKAIPSQDKLSVLSLWLGVSSQWLRFGENSEVQSPLSHVENSEDLEFLSNFQSLTKNQKNILQTLMNEFKSHKA